MASFKIGDLVTIGRGAAPISGRVLSTRRVRDVFSGRHVDIYLIRHENAQDTAEWVSSSNLTVRKAAAAAESAGSWDVYRH